MEENLRHGRKTGEQKRWLGKFSFATFEPGFTFHIWKTCKWKLTGNNILRRVIFPFCWIMTSNRIRENSRIYIFLRTRPSEILFRDQTFCKFSFEIKETKKMYIPLLFLNSYEITKIPKWGNSKRWKNPRKEKRRLEKDYIHIYIDWSNEVAPPLGEATFHAVSSLCVNVLEWTSTPSRINTERNEIYIYIKRERDD